MHPDYLHREDEAQQLTSTSAILDKEGNLVEDDNVLQVLRDFYADLYKNNDVQTHGKVSSFLESLDVPLLSTKIVEGEITSDEVMMAINKLKPSKAPGSDGLTAVFYKQFTGELSTVLSWVFNTAFKVGNLSISKWIAIIILLYKKGQKEDPANYWPISLTNLDYKILAYSDW